MKPMEVEILVAEMGYEGHPDQLFHILYDGTVVDEENFTVLGGEAETIAERLKEGFTESMDLGAALRAAVKALAGPDRTLTGTDLEVAVLARSNGRRAFKRIVDGALEQLLAEPS
jgi:proteasome alpha subunit